MSTRNENNLWLHNPIKEPRFLSYGREITIAVLVKFILLGCLWWWFFKGHKQTVDGEIIAAKLFDAKPTLIQVQKNPESP